MQKHYDKEAHSTTGDVPSDTTRRPYIAEMAESVDKEVAEGSAGA